LATCDRVFYFYRSEKKYTETRFDFRLSVWKPFLGIVMSIVVLRLTIPQKRHRKQPDQLCSGHLSAELQFTNYASVKQRLLSPHEIKLLPKGKTSLLFDEIETDSKRTKADERK
jgi:hypothetical protein